ncbi:MAG: tandem-95 repeat protein, partial [Ilumatobacter sp.]|uniref:Ig-like domain-containing protein n=1 Tax=Ilumatobacter sp. TaxID=1967498 RepID=UPI003297A377
SPTVSVTVVGITPIANADAAVTSFATPVTLPAVTDDVAGDPQGGTPAPLDADATIFPVGGRPAGAQVSADGKSIVVPGQGTWTVDDGGTVTFVPADGFSGQTTSVRYQIADTNGTTVSALPTVTVRPGPVAVPDLEATRQNVPVTFDPIADDTPGERVDGTDGTFDRSTFVFPAVGQPSGAIVSDGGRALDVPGEGVYTVDVEGNVTFTPATTFSGRTTPVRYEVSDQAGNAAESTITVDVASIVPIAVDDAATTVFATPVTFGIVGNDIAGDDSAPIDDDASLSFEAGDNPATWIIGADGTSIVVPGEGSYVFADDGTVTFAPADGFSGVTSPVVYTVRDSNGETATASIQVTVQPGPAARPDTASVPQNTPVTIDVLGNDTPSANVDATPGSFDPASVVFPTTGQPAGATVADGGTTLTVPGQGVYSVRDDGTIVFTPDPRFSGTATPVRYLVTDVGGNTTGSTVTVTVGRVAPTAVDDSARTSVDTAVTIDIVGNDVAGDPAAPIDPTATTFEPGSQPAGSTISDDGTTLTVPNEGTYALDATGRVVFTPVTGFTGETSPVTYTIRDSNGSSATAEITVVVEAPGTSVPSRATSNGGPVTVPVLDNVTPAAGEELVPSSVCLVTTTSSDPCPKRVTVDGVGTWVVNPDGTVTFTPADGYSGTARIDFTVVDTAGNVYQDTVSVEVSRVAAPTTTTTTTTTTPTTRPTTSPNLPRSGAEIFSMLLLALGLLAVGGFATVGSRRRKADEI